jgi:peroxiredoxin
MKKIIFGIITLLVISCNEKSKSKFSLNGTTNGIENGTILYLDIEDKTMDSTKIENNSFSFNSKIPNSPLQVIIRKKDFSQYRFLWAENKPMTFDASKTDFRNAKITGSESENLSFNLHQKIDTLPRNERQKMEMEFVKNNPSSIVSAFTLSVYSTNWGKEKSKELFDKFSIENKNSEFGEKITKYIELNKEPKIGDQFADFEMEDQNGILKKLSDVKGKTVLLEFWASWCSPCLQENPNLVKTYKKFNPKGFEVFAVSLDSDKESWLKEIEKGNLIWKHVSDLKGRGNEASLIYGVNGIPDNFLIAENGEIIGRNLRGDELNEKLKEILE